MSKWAGNGWLQLTSAKTIDFLRHRNSKNYLLINWPSYILYIDTLQFVHASVVYVLYPIWFVRFVYTAQVHLNQVENCVYCVVVGLSSMNFGFQLVQKTIDRFDWNEIHNFLIAKLMTENSDDCLLIKISSSGQTVLSGIW